MKKHQSPYGASSTKYKYVHENEVRLQTGSDAPSLNYLYQEQEEKRFTADQMLNDLSNDDIGGIPIHVTNNQQVKGYKAMKPQELGLQFDPEMEPGANEKLFDSDEESGEFERIDKLSEDSFERNAKEPQVNDKDKFNYIDFDSIDEMEGVIPDAEGDEPFRRTAADDQLFKNLNGDSDQEEDGLKEQKTLDRPQTGKLNRAGEKKQKENNPRAFFSRGGLAGPIDQSSAFQLNTITNQERNVLIEGSTDTKKPRVRRPVSRRIGSENMQKQGIMRNLPQMPNDTDRPLQSMGK